MRRYKRMQKEDEKKEKKILKERLEKIFMGIKTIFKFLTKVSGVEGDVIGYILRRKQQF